MKKDNEDFHYQIKEILGIASPQEDTNKSYVKAVLMTLMGEEEEVGIDIRNFNIEHSRMRSGIRLTPQEASKVCDILLQRGYGSLDIIEEQLQKRKGVFMSSGGDNNV